MSETKRVGSLSFYEPHPLHPNLCSQDCCARSVGCWICSDCKRFDEGCFVLGSVIGSGGLLFSLCFDETAQVALWGRVVCPGWSS